MTSAISLDMLFSVEMFILVDSLKVKSSDVMRADFSYFPVSVVQLGTLKESELLS